MKAEPLDWIESFYFKLMEKEEKTVSIDQLNLLDMATAFGLMAKVLEDEDKAIRFDDPHPRDLIALYDGVFFFPVRDDRFAFEAGIKSMMDILTHRALMSGSPKEIKIPEWNPEDHHAEDCHQLCEVFFVVYAWHLASKDQTLSPENAFGPVMTFSGVVLEGIDRGYHVSDDNMKDLYGDYKKRFHLSVGGEEQVKDLYMQQLDTLAMMLGEWRLPKA